MRAERMGVALVLAGFAVLSSCVGGYQGASGTVQKGGDNRNGEYTATADW